MKLYLHKEIVLKNLSHPFHFEELSGEKGKSFQSSSALFAEALTVTKFLENWKV